MAATFRILFITDRFPPQPGGVAISSERLTRLLAERGHVAHVLHLGANVESASVQSQREGDVMVHRLGALESPEVTLQLADNVIAHLHERVGFQIFHGHSLTPSGDSAAFYAKMSGAKSFVSQEKRKHKYTKVNERIAEEVRLTLRISPESYPHWQQLAQTLTTGGVDGARPRRSGSQLGCALAGRRHAAVAH